MASVQELSPTNWIIRIVIGAIGMSITGTFLLIEISKRKTLDPLPPDIHLQTKYLRLSSLCCLWCGLVSSSLITLSVVPRFCMMRLIGSYVAYLLQLVFLGFYQLSRLYYSFSREQLHQRERGYPLWIFKVMIIYGITIPIMAVVLLPITFPVVATCGYTNNGSFFIVYRPNAILADGDQNTTRMFHKLYWIGSLYWLIWDITTLLLYLYKIWKIGNRHRSKEDGVWDKILSILQRIVILTVFYQFCSFMTSLWLPLVGYVTLPDDVESALDIHRTPTVLTINIIVDSLAIFMMMEHNKTSYICFLRVLSVCHLKFCCFCCWHRMVDRQLEALDTAEVKESELNLKVALSSKFRHQTAVSPTATMQTETAFSNLSKHAVYHVQMREMSVSSTQLNIDTIHEQDVD